MLNFAAKNLYYEEHEQLDSGGGDALSQAAGSFYDTLYSHPKTSSSVHQKVLTTFLEHDSTMMAKDSKKLPSWWCERPQVRVPPVAPRKGFFLLVSLPRRGSK